MLRVKGAEWSDDAAAQCNAVSNGKLANLDPWIKCKCLIQLYNKIAIILNIIQERSIGCCGHRAVPQGVIVGDHSSNLHKLNHPIVIVQVVILISIDEDEIEASLVLFLFMQCNTHSSSNTIDLYTHNFGTDSFFFLKIMCMDWLNSRLWWVDQEEEVLGLLWSQSCEPLLPFQSQATPVHNIPC